MPITVLLETEWVLRSDYGNPRGAIVEAFRRFAGLPGVTLEAPETAAQALTWAEGVLDFADALNLAASRRCEGFRTFDRRLIGSAPEGVALQEP